MGTIRLVSELTSLISELVRIDSVNPALDPSHRGESELARFVADWATARDLGVRWLESTPGRPSVIVTATGTGGDGPRTTGGSDTGANEPGGGRTLLLNAHLDTVGVAGMPAPFTPELRDGRLYGRGAMDMKASLAACMVAVARAATLGLAGDVILTAVADEEHDSIGTRETLAALTGQAGVTPVAIDGAIVTEPSDLEVHVAHRGFALFEVGLEGVASHTSQPERGVNALVHLGRLLSAVEELDRDLRRREPHPLVAHGSLQPVLARGGHELFTTPNHATVTIERRTLPGETAAAVRQELNELLDGLTSRDPTVTATVAALVAREPFEAQAGSEIERLLLAAIATERGVPAALLGAPYWTDAALIAAAGIPTLLFGPVGGGIHQPGEWVDLDSVHVMARVLDRVIDGFCA